MLTMVASRGSAIGLDQEFESLQNLILLPLIMWDPHASKHARKKYADFF
jgi:hypothetical protein